MSRTSSYWNRLSRYFIPGALGVFMVYGIGSGYMSALSSGSELNTGKYESTPVTDPGLRDPYRPALKDVFFDRDSSAIRDDAKPVLDENAQALRSEPGMYVVIESYCDSREDSPAHLGTKRAEAVRDYMGSRGVDSERILVVNKCNKYDMELVNSRDSTRLDSRVHFVPLDESQDRDRVALAR